MRTQVRLNLSLIFFGMLTFAYTQGAAAQTQTDEVKENGFGRTTTHIETAHTPQNVPDHAVANESMVGTESSKTFDKLHTKYDPLLEQPTRSYNNNVSDTYEPSSATDEELVVTSSPAGAAENENRAPQATPESQPVQPTEAVLAVNIPHEAAPAPVEASTVPAVVPQQKAPAEQAAARPQQNPSRSTAPQPVVAVAAAPSACSCPTAVAAPQVIPAPTPARTASKAIVPKASCSANHISAKRVLYAKKGRTPLYNHPHGAKVKQMARGDHFLPGAKRKGWVEVPGRGWVKQNRFTIKPVGRCIAERR